MAEAMAQQPKSSIRKADSLPNVHFDGNPIIGSAFELPINHIPVDRGHNVCIKPEEVECDGVGGGTSGEGLHLGGLGRG